MKDESHYSSVWIHAPYDGAPEVVATFCTCISGLVGCHHSASLLTHLENAALTPCSALVANFFAALFHISSALDHSPGGKYPSEPFNHFFAALLQKQAFSAESLGILLENQSSCRFWIFCFYFFIVIFFSFYFLFLFFIFYFYFYFIFIFILFFRIWAQCLRSRHRQGKAGPLTFSKRGFSWPRSLLDFTLEDYFVDFGHETSSASWLQRASVIVIVIVIVVVVIVIVVISFLISDFNDNGNWDSKIKWLLHVRPLLRFVHSKEWV